MTALTALWGIASLALGVWTYRELDNDRLFEAYKMGEPIQLFVNAYFA